MIYTCYFSGLGDRSGRAYSICEQQPPKWRLPRIDVLCPPYGMLWKFMRGRMSQRRFAQLYKMRFSLIDPYEIAARYDGMILTAWEGYEDKEKTKLKFSHRHLVAEWLRGFGIEVCELPPECKKRRVGF